ncbi:hypothetical protein D3C75_1285340 [compost metagenome]
MLNIMVLLGVGNGLEGLPDSLPFVAVENAAGLIHHIHAVLLADGQVLEYLVKGA